MIQQFGEKWFSLQWHLYSHDYVSLMSSQSTTKCHETVKYEYEYKVCQTRSSHENMFEVIQTS